MIKGKELNYLKMSGLPATLYLDFLADLRGLSAKPAALIDGTYLAGVRDALQWVTDDILRGIEAIDPNLAVELREAIIEREYK